VNRNEKDSEEQNADPGENPAIETQTVARARVRKCTKIKLFFNFIKLQIRKCAKIKIFSSFIKYK
jgi:hypothetical protein